MNCVMHRGLKLVEHAMKIVENVLEKRLRKIMAIDDMQFGFMPGKCTIDAVFILRCIQEEYLANKKKLYMCFVDLVKASDSYKESCGTGNEKGIPEALATTVMSLYNGGRTKVNVGTHFSEEFEANVGAHP